MISVILQLFLLFNLKCEKMNKTSFKADYNGEVTVLKNSARLKNGEVYVTIARKAGGKSEAESIKLDKLRIDDQRRRKIEKLVLNHLAKDKQQNPYQSANNFVPAIRA